MRSYSQTFNSTLSFSMPTGDPWGQGSNASAAPFIARKFHAQKSRRWDEGYFAGCIRTWVVFFLTPLLPRLFKNPQ